ncbi:MAG: hypothetical protein ACREIA_01850, partial [Opitutaceae bacterium]
MKHFETRDRPVKASSFSYDRPLRGHRPTIPTAASAGILCTMTLLELKQEITRLSLRERRELNAYMVR